MKQQQRWGFLTNHALVLVFVVRHSGATVREISAGVGVTERATLEILRILSEEGIVERHREGRRNTYSVDFDALAAYRREGTVTLTPRVSDIATASRLYSAENLRRAPMAPLLVHSMSVMRSP